MPDDLTAELAKAKKIADGLQSATRFLGKKPDFYGCGGPAAEAYWEHFTPARIVSLLAALRAVLELAGNAKVMLSDAPADCSGECWVNPCDCSGVKPPLAWDLDPAKVREAITRELNGGGGDGT